MQIFVAAGWRDEMKFEKFVLDPNSEIGGLVDSWLVRSLSRAPRLVNSTPEGGVWVRVLARDIVPCSSLGQDTY